MRLKLIQSLLDFMVLYAQTSLLVEKLLMKVSGVKATAAIYCSLGLGT
jgi:hypothetical protein